MQNKGALVVGIGVVMGLGAILGAGVGILFDAEPSELAVCAGVGPAVALAIFGGPIVAATQRGHRRRRSRR